MEVNLVKVSSLAAKTCGAVVVEPSETNIIHPPNLGSTTDCGIDADERQVLKVIDINGSEGAVGKSRARGNRDDLRANLDILAGRIKLIACEGEDAGRA
jgi:hypothetical protein